MLNTLKTCDIVVLCFTYQKKWTKIYADREKATQPSNQLWNMREHHLGERFRKLGLIRSNQWSQPRLFKRFGGNIFGQWYVCRSQASQILISSNHHIKHSMSIWKHHKRHWLFSNSWLWIAFSLLGLVKVVFFFFP